MRVFVLNTGRCGSMTFTRASNHATNYSTGHETRSSLVGADRLAYPDQHIEADNRLSWFLGGLDSRYGSDAFYVHLVRDPAAVAASFVRRWPRPGGLDFLRRLRPHARREGIIAAFAHSIVMQDRWSPNDRLRVAQFYVETVTKNIEAFLRDKPLQLTVSVDSFRDDYQRFWAAVGAQGDLVAALAELDVLYNAST